MFESCLRNYKSQSFVTGFFVARCFYIGKAAFLLPFNSRASESHGTRSNDREQPRVKEIKNTLNRFFGIAPNTGADTDF